MTDSSSALVIWNWRETIIKHLREPVESTSVDDAAPVVNADGTPADANVEEDFYAKSLQSQGKLQTYLTAYAAALSDRKGELYTTCCLSSGIELIIRRDDE
jgi:E3 ubiquitin-protein ligase SHPRH